MKKLTKLLCCGVLTCIMGISTMQTHIAANETHTGESATEKKQANVNDITAAFTTTEDGTSILVLEDKNSGADIYGYYEITYTNRTPHLISFPNESTENTTTSITQPFEIKMSGTAEILITLNSTVPNAPQSRSFTVTHDVEKVVNANIDDVLNIEGHFFGGLGDDNEFLNKNEITIESDLSNSLDFVVNPVLKEGTPYKFDEGFTLKVESTNPQILDWNQTYERLTRHGAFLPEGAIKGYGEAVVNFLIVNKKDGTQKSFQKTFKITKPASEPVPEEPKDEVTYISGKDIFLTDQIKQQAIDMIQHADKAATIHLHLKENLKTITLPKELLQAAKDKNVPLTVNVEMNGSMNTWTFESINEVMDINLSMSIRKPNDAEAAQAKDSLVLAFEHSGRLPEGTTVKTYVGDTFQPKQNVQLSYFNETTGKLEETKRYTVDDNGYVTVVINHCSDYVLQAANDVSVSETIKPEEKKDTEAAAPADLNKKDVTEKKKSDVLAGSVNTGDHTNTYFFITLLAFSGVMVIASKKKAKITK